MSKQTPFRSFRAALVLCTALGISATAGATIVSTIDPYSATPTPGVWFESDTRAGGTVSVADLTGVGGALESTAPLPVGAAEMVQIAIGVDSYNPGQQG
jgi:hypothetical protein